MNNNFNKDVENKNIILLRLTNKDIKKKRRLIEEGKEKLSKDSLFTTYFENVFSGSCKYTRLCGGIEIFFNKKINGGYSITHPKNQPIICKNIDKESIFPYDIIKNKSKYRDKFTINIPIEITCNCEEKMSDFNNNYNKKYFSKEDYNIMGIDRGENNLIYYTIVNSATHKIIEQQSLNNINDTDYNKLLTIIQDYNTSQKQNWEKIRNIKSTKTGYISYVVHNIINIINKHNIAYIAIENLSNSFFRGRQKIEKNVYVQFENGLINKLSYIKDKNDPRKSGEQMQLSDSKSKQLQNGIIVKINPAYTSNIDPVTRFQNLFDYNTYMMYSNVANSKKFFEKFDDVVFENDLFKFTFDYKKFKTKVKDIKKFNVTKWTVCSFGERVDKNNWFNIQTKFITLFEKYNIDINQNIKKQILNINSADFWKEMIHLFSLLIKVRNSGTKGTTYKDLIISPVMDSNGNFFNSDFSTNELPKDGDANGQYNIQIKGIIQMNNVKNGNKIKVTEADYFNFKI